MYACPLKFPLNGLKKRSTQTPFLITSITSKQGDFSRRSCQRDSLLWILLALKWPGSTKRKWARLPNPRQDATSSGGGKGPTKGGAPCEMRRRGTTPTDLPLDRTESCGKQGIILLKHNEGEMKISWNKHPKKEKGNPALCWPQAPNKVGNWDTEEVPPRSTRARAKIPLNSCNVPPTSTSVTLNRVWSRLAQRSPGLETRWRRLGHPLKDARSSSKPSISCWRWVGSSAGCLILTSSTATYSSLCACILARRTRVYRSSIAAKRSKRDGGLLRCLVRAASALAQLSPAFLAPEACTNNEIACYTAQIPIATKIIGQTSATSHENHAAALRTASSPSFISIANPLNYI